MQSNKINCPNCGHEIDVNELLYHQIEHDLKANFQKQLAEKENLYQEKEAKMKKQLENSIKEKIEEKYKENEKLLQNKIRENSEKLKELTKLKAETEKMKLERIQIEDKLKKEYELRMNKIITKETEKIKKNTQSEIERKLTEKDIVINQLKKLATEAKRKAEQVSIQVQGEAQEICIEQWLKKMFPDDEILEVKKGVKGADCIHTVMHSGERCAKICYESKRTKVFQQSWIVKLKNDMISEKANVGVIITETMPPGAADIIQIDGIWICSFSASKSLCIVIREFVLKAYHSFSVNNRKKDKMELLYVYLTGDEFRMQIETILNKISEMKLQIDKEKTDTVKLWRKREELIDSMIKSTTNICFSIKQITGKSLPETNSIIYLPEH